MTPHIEAKKEDIAKTVIMPGDPLRAKYIAETFLTDVKQINSVRNMLGYTGKYKNKKITVFASGMGVPSIGIYALELYKFYDVENIIRIGTCGSFHKNIKLRDIILSEGAFSKSYFDMLLDNKDINYIESSKKLNDIIIEKANKSNIKIKYGKTITSDVFDLYVDDIKEFESNFDNDEYLAVEMEAFGLFYLANKFNKKSACLLTVVDSKYDKGSISKEEREKDLNDMIKLALETSIDL